MSWRNPAWDIVGIEPTSDLRAIRVAYTRKLKTINVEGDPQAFIALREAYEACQREAEWVDHVWDDDEADEEEDDWQPHQPEAPDPFGLISDTEIASLSPASQLPNRAAEDGAAPVLRPVGEAEPEEAPAPPSPPEPSRPRPEPWRPKAASMDAQAHAEALSRLLAELGDTNGAGHASEIVSHWNAIVADPRMQEVAFYADAEQWFAGLISRTIPASDPLVRIASAHFGWDVAAETIHQTPTVAYILQRRRALAFRDAVLQRKHRWHRAWKELERPAGEGSRRGNVDGSTVRTLILTVRRDYPDLESDWDWYRVAMWDGTQLNNSAVGRWLGRFAVFAVILLIGLFSFAFDVAKHMPKDGAPRLVELQKLTDPEKDIPLLLKVVGDGSLKWADVQTRNPKLAALLRANWKAARDRGDTLARFGDNAGDFLLERYRAGLRTAPYELVADYRALTRDKANAILAKSAEDCDAWFRGKAPAPKGTMSPALLARERALVSRTLIETSAEPAARAGRTTFTLPGKVSEAAAKAAGISRERFSAAMLDKGTPSDRCKARIALLNTALALPHDEGLKLLREM